MTRATITDALRQIFQGIKQLENAFPNRAFTIDGRLVGDIGEVIAALEYDLVLHGTSQPIHVELHAASPNANREFFRLPLVQVMQAVGEACTTAG